VLLSVLALTSFASAQANGRVVAPKQLSAKPVAYPKGASGDADVLLELDIAEDGSVAGATVRRGSDPFGAAARRGVMDWRFEPALRNGVPVRVGISVTVTFKDPRPIIAALGPVENEPLPEEVAMDPDAVEPLAEVVVRSEGRAEIGGTLIPREEARLIPGTFADPFRVAEVLPGIAPILSGLPYFFVRGAPPGNIGYIIDGIRVPLLFHVGAGPSVIAPSLVERVDVIPSAYPARFGRSAGGIIAGETTTLGQVARGEFQARVFDASALIEVPLAESRASLMMAGRYSYVQPLLDRVSPDYELGYWDYQSKAGYQLNANNAISVFAFGASDRLESRPLQRTLFDTAFHRIDLRWDRTTDDGSSRVAITAGTDRVATAEEDSISYQSQIEDRSLRLRWETDQKVATGIILRTGMDYGLNRVNKELDTRPAEMEVFPKRIDLSGSAYLDTILRGPGVEVVPGLRTDAALWRNEGYIFLEPRLATRLRLLPRLFWVSQLGIAHQLPTQSVRIPGQAADPLEASVQEAWQAAQGLELVLSPNVLGKVTGFHSWVDSDENDRTGRSYGIEAFLRREFIEDLGGIISYTLSRTEATSGRDTVPSEFDRTHVLSAVLGWNMGAGFRLGVRGYYASGRRYTIYCPTPRCGPGDPTAPRIFWVRGRLADFYRADFRFEKRWEIGYTGWFAVTLEWFNATLSKEATSVDWLPATGGLVSNEREPLTLPSIGIEGGF
jgi:TonB family protein